MPEDGRFALDGGIGEAGRTGDRRRRPAERGRIRKPQPDQVQRLLGHRVRFCCCVARDQASIAAFR